MAASLRYETTSCSRCGGTGHYSYCTMYGTTCFKCGGRKRYLSKAGANAAAKINAFIADHFSVTVEDLKPGDRIKVPGTNVHRTIATVETEGHARFSAGTDPETGDPIWKDYITVTFTKPVKGALGPYSSHGFLPGTRVTTAVAGADWDAVVAYARTLLKRRLKGLTIVEEETPAEVAGASVG